jgi:hypothetical protein
LACNLANPCLGHEPKARVATFKVKTRKPRGKNKEVRCIATINNFRKNSTKHTTTTNNFMNLNK